MMMAPASNTAAAMRKAGPDAGTVLGVMVNE